MFLLKYALVSLRRPSTPVNGHRDRHARRHGPAVHDYRFELPLSDRIDDRLVEWRKRWRQLHLAGRPYARHTSLRVEQDLANPYPASTCPGWQPWIPRID